LLQSAQQRVLNRLRELATGSFGFVGGVEMKLTDSGSGAILVEGIDQQVGRNAIQTAATWQWQDAERRRRRVRDCYLQTLRSGG